VLSEEQLTRWMEGQSTSTAWLTGGVRFVDKVPRDGVSLPLRNSIGRNRCVRGELTALTRWENCSAES
jgi:hypothetical protein